MVTSNFMKKFCILMSVLLSLGMFSACSNSDESTEVMAGNGGFLNAEVEYVDLESLPGWLISWISSIEEKRGQEKSVFRKGHKEWGDNPQLFRGVCAGSVFYCIYNHLNSCVFCDSYYENGEQLDFHDEDFVQAFEEAIPKMKRIYIK